MPRCKFLFRDDVLACLSEQRPVCRKPVDVIQPMEAARLSDEALVAAYRQASPDVRRALADELFGRHYERVARWCYRFTGDREAAADLAQDVFVKAYRHLDSFQATARSPTWLYVIVRPESLNRLERRAPDAAAEADEALADVPTSQPGPEELVVRQSRRRRLHGFLAETLDDTERTV